MAPSNNTASMVDWLSAGSSVAAAIIGMVTLLTVYIGAMQFLSQNRMYTLGLSWRSLGPWRHVVGKTALLGLQWRIRTPSVSLESLVKGGRWEPNLCFPRGFPRHEDQDVEAGDYVQGKATWVNFMQCLGLPPKKDTSLYEMLDASELVNGIVPMHWRGKDLVSICSILGFQSYEDYPSWKAPMPMPMQWTGPLGWLQFRSSSNGCVAEFRRRMVLGNCIKQTLHDQYQAQGSEVPQQKHFLKSRLWNSIDGLILPDGWTLFLDGTDKYERRQDAEDDEYADRQTLYQSITSDDHSDDQILRMLFGKVRNQPPAIRRRGAPQHQHDKTSGLLSSTRDDTEDFVGGKHVFKASPGLLSGNIEGELAYNRGLSIEKCHEYERKIVPAADIDHERFPFHLGDMYMDGELLGLLKEGLLYICPDGFYFSPTFRLGMDLYRVYRHIDDQSNWCKGVLFRASAIPPGATPTVEDKEGGPRGNSAASTLSWQDHLRFSMMLCNELQHIRKDTRATFTVEDTRLIAHVFAAVKKIVGERDESNEKDEEDEKNKWDIIWAFIYHPNLSRDIRRAVNEVRDMPAFLSGRVSSRNGLLDCVELIRSTGIMIEETMEEIPGTYRIPLLADGEFTGAQVLAALSVVLINYFWLDSSWDTDVAAYDFTIPQSVMMC